MDKLYHLIFKTINFHFFFRSYKLNYLFLIFSIMSLYPPMNFPLLNIIGIVFHLYLFFSYITYVVNGYYYVFMYSNSIPYFVKYFLALLHGPQNDVPYITIGFWLFTYEHLDITLKLRGIVMDDGNLKICVIINKYSIKCKNIIKRFNII